MDEYKILMEYEKAKQNGTLPEMPETLDVKCRELINEAFGCARRRARAKRIGRAVVKAAMVVLILFGLSTTMVLSVDAFRVPVLNYLVGRNEKYTSINSGQILYTESSTLDKVIRRINEDIPEGYALINSFSTDIQYSVVYQNNEKHVIQFTCSKENCIIKVDTEDTAYISLAFGEFAAVFSEKKGYKLMWIDDQIDTLCTLYVDGMSEEAFWEYAYWLIS